MKGWRKELINLDVMMMRVEKSPERGVGLFQPIVGPENWPLLLQKLHSRDAMYEVVTQGTESNKHKLR